jgi:metallophosphoesterase (TIGR00282 family)
MALVRILFIGDVVGQPGCQMFQKHTERLVKDHAIAAVIVNGENSAADGRGITPRLAAFFKQAGARVITTGNHIWNKREIYSYLEQHADVLRPANFPSGAPGVGMTTFEVAGATIGVINIQGRVFMREHLDCPFKTVESLLTYLKHKTKTILVDFHAETTSEKMAMGYFLDGKVSAVVGTHTHVQTADERVLPKGTAYISDLGMAGSLNSSLGMQKEPIINSFITQMPVKFSVSHEPPFIMQGVVIEIDTSSGKAVSIKRIQVLDTDLQISDQD